MCTARTSLYFLLCGVTRSALLLWCGSGPCSGHFCRCHALCGAHFTRCQWIPDPEVLIQTCVWEDSHLTFIAPLKSSLRAEALMKNIRPNRLLKLLQLLYAVFFFPPGRRGTKQAPEEWELTEKDESILSLTYLKISVAFLRINPKRGESCYRWYISDT